MEQKEPKKYCPDCNIIIENCLFCWEKELKEKLREANNEKQKN